MWVPVPILHTSPPRVRLFECVLATKPIAKEKNISMHISMDKNSIEKKNNMKFRLHLTFFLIIICTLYY